MQSPSSVQAAYFDWDSLPPVKEPFLPAKKATDHPYTLVLDLDETLIHFVDSGADSFFHIRPGCSKFLEDLHHYYEVVIFTAAMQDYADSVLDTIDPEQKFIQYRLYR